jgi:hypothetical protein
MTDKFLGTGSIGGNLANGTLSIYGSKIGAKNLDPSRAVKTDSQGRLQTTDLDIADVNNLQSVLDNVLTNPYTPPIGEKFVVNGDIDCTNTLYAPDIRTTTISDIIGDGATIDLTQTSINMYVPTLNPILTFNDKPIISTPYTGTIQSNSIATSRIFDYNQSISIDLDSTTVNVVSPYLKFNDEPIIHQNYPSYIQASSFIKTGGTNNQYLMADGSSLQYSANSGNSNFYLYKSHSNTPALPVDDGFVYYNNNAQASATKIYISHKTDDNIDIEVFFNNLSSLNDVYLQQKSQSNNFIKYNISSVVIFPTQYIEINVVATSGGGTGLTSFGVNEPILVSFFTNTIETSQRLSTLENKTQNIASITVGIDTNFQGTLTSTGFKTSGGTVGQFLKANGTVDSNSYIQASGSSTQYLKGNGTLDNNSYNNTQYLMNVSPAILSSSTVETNIFGTGLTTNNMSMAWTDALNYSRTIYIAGKISHNPNATLTIRFRISGGTIIIPWAINMTNVSVATPIPFTMVMNYTVKAPNSYTYSCNFSEAGITAGTTYMANNTVTCTLGSYNRLITAQWGAVGANNSLEITELNIKNIYIG